MTNTSSYRSDARAVRLAAQEHLASLRAARRARRGVTGAAGSGASPNLSEPEIGVGQFFPPARPIPDAATDAGHSMATETPDSVEEAVFPATGSVEECGAEPPGQENGFEAGIAEIRTDLEPNLRPTPDAEIAGLMVADRQNTEGAEPKLLPPANPDRPDREAVESDASMPVKEGASPVVSDQPAAHMQEAAFPSEAENTETSSAATAIGDDLSELPGAGAGMIWMFQKCGISNLKELAAADPRVLSTQLGVVGNILNVEPWIEFARERQRTIPEQG